MKTNMFMAVGLGAVLVSTSAMAHIIGFSDYYAAPAGTYAINGTNAGNWLLTKGTGPNDAAVSLGATSVSLLGSSFGGADTMKFTIQPQNFPAGDDGFLFSYQGYANLLQNEEIGYVVGANIYPLAPVLNPTLIRVQPVQVGDAFGFYVVSDGGVNPANINIGDFQTVPEPGQVAAMGLTLVGVASYLVRRRVAKFSNK